jgi:hypothetical protein
MLCAAMLMGARALFPSWLHALLAGEVQGSTVHYCDESAP